MAAEALNRAILSPLPKFGELAGAPCRPLGTAPGVAGSLMPELM
jgi:hypothetical protein